MATIRRREGGTNSTVLKRREYSTAFSPNQVAGCSLWLDGADPIATGTPPADGTSLSTWSDKSSSGYNAINVNNAATVRTNIQNSNSVIRFNSSRYSVTYPSFPYTGYTFFVVMYLSTNSGSYQRLINGSFSDAYLFIGTNGGSIATFNGPGTWNDINTNSPSITNFQNWRIVVVTVGSSVLTPYVDGTAQNTKAGSTAAFSNLYIGDVGQNYIGDIGEIIVYNSVLDSTQRQTVESYLAQKWGLTGSLPSGHRQFTQPAGKPNTVTDPIIGVYPILKPVTSSFTPTSIAGIQMWMDAADSSSSSMTLSGSTVTQWRDKSGVGNNTTARSGTSTLVSSAINGRSAISMAGGYFTGPFATANTGTQLHAFAVISIDSSSGVWPRPLSLGRPGVDDYGSSTTTFAIIRYSGSQAVAIGRNGQYLNVGFPSYSSPFLVQSSHNGATEFMSVNGNLTVNSLNTGQTGNFNITSYGLGVNTNTGDYFVWNGYYAEVIYYNVQLSLANRQILEGYLAWKWGLQTSLPAGHPYYSAAP
jgi:hypothetical protein